MFITEDQLRERLNSPRNLANRFKNGREISDATEKESEPKAEDIVSKDVHQESIQFREIKRPGNNRPWLSKQERTGIAADYATQTCDGNKVTQKEIAEKYGVQISTVSDIVNGSRRVPESPRSVDQAKVDAQLDKVREAAIDKLMVGLGQLTDDKVSAHNAKDISAICANMARVVQQTIPQEKSAQQINLVVYTPELRKEQNFNSIEV